MLALVEIGHTRLDYSPASTADQVDDQDDDGDDDDDVDQASADVQGKAKEPKHDKNYENCPKHSDLQEGKRADTQEGVRAFVVIVDYRGLVGSNGLVLCVSDGVNERMSRFRNGDFALQNATG